MDAEKEIILAKFGAHIRTIRQSQGKTQLEISASMKRDQQSLQRVERGKVNPSLTYLLELAQALEISLEELLNFSR